jgi:putative transposase
MPRRVRLKLAGLPVHLIQRGNNRSACFFTEEDYAFYLDQLGRLCRSEAIALHAYVLMTNHVHLLLTPAQAEGSSRLMKQLGQRYVQYVNRRYQRSGTLWEGRFRSCLVQAENYLLGCQRYIELNPVRAAMVLHPAEYRWSSYRTHAQGEVSALVSPHAQYLALGDSQAERQGVYRELFRYQLDPGLVDEIRASTNGGYALGHERFQREVAAMAGRCAWRGQAGRPRKSAEGANRDRPSPMH